MDWSNEFSDISAGQVRNIKDDLRALDIIEDSHLSSFGKELYRSIDNINNFKSKLAEKFIIDKKGWAYCYVLDILPGETRFELEALYQNLFDTEISDDRGQDISGYNKLLYWLGAVDKVGNSYQLNNRFNPLNMENMFVKLAHS